MKIALLLKSLSYKPDPPTKESLLSQQVVNFYFIENTRGYPGHSGQEQ